MEEETPEAAAAWSQQTIELLNLCRGNLTRLNRHQLHVAARNFGINVNPAITKDQLCQEIRREILRRLPESEEERWFTAGLWRGPKGGELKHLIDAYERFREVVLEHPFLVEYLFAMHITLPHEIRPALVVEGTLNGYRVVVVASTPPTGGVKVRLHYPPEIENLVYSREFGPLLPRWLQTLLDQYEEYRRPEGYRTAVHHFSNLERESLDPDTGLLFRLWYHPGFVPEHVYFCIDKIHIDDIDRLLKSECKDVWPKAKAKLFSGAQSQLFEDTLRKQAFEQLPNPLKLATILYRPFDPEAIDVTALTRLEHAINSLTQVMQEFRTENPQVPFASNDVTQYLPYQAFKRISTNPDYQYLFTIPEVENRLQDDEPFGDYRRIMHFLSFTHNQLV
jgi:hypothetical protein